MDYPPLPATQNEPLLVDERLSSLSILNPNSNNERSSNINPLSIPADIRTGLNEEQASERLAYFGSKWCFKSYFLLYLFFLGFFTKHTFFANLYSFIIPFSPFY